MRLKHAAASHVGLVRRQNEDSFVAGGGVYAVCDGMGGARAGEVASEAACRVLMELTPGAGADRVRQAVAEANRLIYLRGTDESDLSGMGTTLTAVIQSDDGLLIAHVGDSRAYLLRDGGLEQLTQDHSLVAEMVRRGQITQAQAAVHPHRSIITRALGTEPEVEPDILPLLLQAGDRLLLCSDGVSGMVREEEISRLLAEGDDPDAIARSLVDAALRGGGEDNATVVVLMAEDDNHDAEEGQVSDGAGAPDERPVFGPERRKTAAAIEQMAGGIERVRARIGRVGDKLGQAAPPLGRVPGGLKATGGWLRGHRRRLIITGVVVMLVLVLGVVAFVAFNSTVYFVGIASSGQVALFHGVPYALLGMPLYTLVEVGGIQYSALQPYLQARVDTHELTTKEEGQQFVRGLVFQP